MKTPLHSGLRSWLPQLLVAGGLAAAGLARSAEQPKPPAFAGTFGDGRVTLQLRPVPGQAASFTGSIRLGEENLPATATERAGGLNGTFESQGDRFDFIATLEREVVTLSTDGATYKLKRRAVNPLAPAPEQGAAVERASGAAPRATPPVSDKAPAAARAGGAIRLKRVGVLDDSAMIGGEAASILIPENWKLEGGVRWRAHPALPAYLAFKVFNPNGAEVLEVLPTIPCVWVEGGVPFFPPGSIYLGNEVAEPVPDAVAFTKKFVLPRFRPGLRDPKIVTTEDLPKVAEAVVAASAEPGVQKTARAARLRLEYAEQGKTFEEDLFCVVVVARVTQLAMPATTFWGSERTYSFKAEKGKLDDQSKLFQTIAASGKPDLKWVNKYLQLVQMLVQNQMQAIRRTGELSRYIAKTSDEINEIRRSTWENQQRSQDRIAANFSHYIRGVEEYKNPFEDRPVELPSGYREVWANPQGEYILSDNANFDPNVGDTRTWQRLDKTK